MNSVSFFLKWLPAIFLLLLGFLAYVLNFNGLYGQDAHEYLRQSQQIFDRWSGLPQAPAGLGDAEFAGGYPLMGALLRLFLSDSVWAMQAVSCLAAALGLWFFERLLALLAPGARAESRWVFAGLGLALSPLFFRAGLSSMSDALGLVFALAAAFFAFRSMENGRLRDAVLLAVFMAWAMITRFALAGLLAPLGLAAGFFWFRQNRWVWLCASAGAFFLAALPHFWLKAGGLENPLGHTMLQDWHLGHFFQRSFSNENGHSNYLLPNILFLLFPLAHPSFCLLLPGLFLLCKRTDWLLPAKRILLMCMGAYLLLLGGLPHQNTRYLLPVYAFVLLLLFPAWDRLYCYGFLFFRKTTWAVLVLVFVLQVFFSARALRPLLLRNRLETDMAATLRQTLPPDATLFAFDLDVALRSYLPGVSMQNLWERRYATYPPGAFVLFNESLRAQWAGQNPVLNWDDLRKNYPMAPRDTFSEGWILWEIEK